jgi:hypothetical protein
LPELTEENHKCNPGVPNTKAIPPSVGVLNPEGYSGEGRGKRSFMQPTILVGKVGEAIVTFME